jgi:hypothetical protein
VGWGAGGVACTFMDARRGHVARDGVRHGAAVPYVAHVHSRQKHERQAREPAVRTSREKPRSGASSQHSGLEHSQLLLSFGDVLVVDLDERFLPEAFDVGLVVALERFVAGVFAEAVLHGFEARDFRGEALLHFDDVPGGL